MDKRTCTGRKKTNGPPTSNFDQNSKRQKQHGEPCPSIENFRIMVHPLK